MKTICTCLKLSFAGRLEELLKEQLNYRGDQFQRLWKSGKYCYGWPIV